MDYEGLINGVMVLLIYIWTCTIIWKKKPVKKVMKNVQTYMITNTKPFEM